MLPGLLLWEVATHTSTPLCRKRCHLEIMPPAECPLLAAGLNRCVCLYAQGAVLDQVPSIARGHASNDDKIYELYHEIVMSNAEVDRLVRRQQDCTTSHTPASVVQPNAGEQ